MCGRYSFSIPSKAKSLVKLGIPQPQLAKLKPRYNIAPSQQVASIVDDGARHLEPLRWGLVPSWAEDEKIGYKMINARAESLTEKPSFKHLLNKQRCLIPASSFFEWKGEGPAKTPYLFRMKSEEPFAFAGLWSSWNNPKGGTIRSCAIITTTPNKLVAPVHNRMPVILSEKYLEHWLDRNNIDGMALTNLLKPYPADQMESYAVSKIVNLPTNDREDCLHRIAK